MSVWKSDEKLLFFQSLISPSQVILFEKEYQAWDKAVFHHQMKHFEVRQKYSLARRISTLFSVFHLVTKHCLSRVIYYVKWGQVKKSLMVLHHFTDSGDQ